MQDAAITRPASSDDARGEPDSGTQHVLFTAKGGVYALPLGEVLEVIEPEWWVRIPHAAPWVEGLLYHHGDPLVVANVGALLDGVKVPGDGAASVLRLKAGGMKFGILVDRVAGTWRSRSPATPCRGTAFVKAVWERNGKLVNLIDLEALLDRASCIFTA